MASRGAGFGEVRYRAVRPGVDIRIAVEDAALAVSVESDPGSDPSGITFSYEGVNRISTDSDGVVRLDTTVGALFHDTRTGRIARAGRDDPFGRRENPAALRWSGFLGGSLAEYGYSIAARTNGATVVAGLVQSPDFPATIGAAYDSLAGSYDAFAAEIDASGGSLTWATFLGGSGVDLAQALALADTGDLLLTGKTESSDFPVTAGAYDTSHGGGADAFVTRLSADGSSLVWSSFLGGAAYEIAFGLIEDAGAGVIVGGYTSSSDYPTTRGAYDETYNGGFDCFLTKLDAAGGDILWSTLLGGANDDRIYDIARSADERYSSPAWTQSSDFPTTPGAYDRVYDGGGDAYVAKVDPSGSVLSWSTLLGGADIDRAYAIAVDANGEPVVAGLTRSSAFPATAGALIPYTAATATGSSRDSTPPVPGWSGAAISAADPRTGASTSPSMRRTM